jgi:hypothetical protein
VSIADEKSVYIEMREIALDVGWETRRVRGWLRRGGAAVKRNGRWVTTMDLLRDSFPEIWVRFSERRALKAMAESDPNDTKRHQTTST